MLFQFERLRLGFEVTTVQDVLRSTLSWLRSRARVLSGEFETVLLFILEVLEYVENNRAEKTVTNCHLALECANEILRHNDGLVTSQVGVVVFKYCI